MDSSTSSFCAAGNLSVKNYLLTNQHIKTVVMAGHWSAYFREDGLLATSSDNAFLKRSDVASNALISTLQWLHDQGKIVTLIGPVPVYDKSVPQTLALDLAMGRKFMHSSLAVQQQKNADFFKVVNDAKLNRHRAFQFLDPIQWLCVQDCMVIKDGIPLYRDSNHISIVGAKALMPYLSKGFDASLIMALPLLTIANKFN